MQVPVSVILPVYKGEAYLENAISSILQQTFTDFEFIIVNDASPDRSEEVVNRFNDGRIKYYKSDTNLGLVGALNKGISLSSGKYIARMDQDDFSFPDRLKKQFEFLESHPGYIIAGTQVTVLGTGHLKKYPSTNEEIKVALLFGSPFAHPAVMFRRSVLVDNKLTYEEQFRHAEDFGLWMRLSSLGKMINLDYVGLDYRVHETQYTQVFSDRTRDVHYAVRDEYLRKLGAVLSQQDREMLEMISRKEIDLTDEPLLRSIGDFFGRMPSYLEKSNLDQHMLKNFIYGRWKRFCTDRAKKGLKAHSIFRSSAVSRWKNDLPLRLWFVKQYLRS